MKHMKKEYIFLLFIIVFIILLEVITNFIAEKSVNKILEELGLIRSEIENSNDYDNIKNKIKDLKSDWKKEENKLSYFGEHTELEKIDHAISICEEYYNNEDIKETLVYIAEAEFWLHHFYEKDSFALKSVF